MLNTPLGRLRAVGLTEALSFLLLVGVAMPLKYLGDEPRPVQVVGMAHGVLWVLYLGAVANAAVARRGPAPPVAVAQAASVVPPGPFFFDPSLRREEVVAKQH